MSVSDPKVAHTELLKALTGAARELDVQRARRVYVNRNLRMDEIELIGFDMDYTLAIYNQARLERLSYDCTLRKLVDQKGYPAEILGLSYDTQFGVRGIVVDRRYGNVFKMDRHGHVGRVFHGRRALDKEERRSLYRMQKIRLSAPRYAWIDTLFALPEAVMYAALVEFLEARNGRLRFARLWDDIRECIDEAHRDESLKSVIKADLAGYLYRDPDLATALHKFRSSGKRLFLLTNSLLDYTDRLMSYLLDGQLPAYPSWRSFFDVIIVGAQKPAFFTEKRPLVELDAQGRILRQIDGGPLLRGRLYQGGNVHAFEQLAGAGGDHVLYIGDHIYGDMLRAKKESVWRTAMIVQELEEELGLMERLAARLEHLEGLERRRAQLDSEIHYQQLVLKSLQRFAEGGGAEGTAVEGAKRQAQQVLTELRQTLRATIADCDGVEDEVERAFNPYWGPLFKEGHENSRFGEQVEDYACLYTSRVSNFLAYSPLQYFRAPRDHMPHEVG